jgi:membrane associated rhomboid family serine protease
MNKYLFYPYEVKHHHGFYRFLSHPFLHGDLAHLLFNSITMFYFGSFLESFMIARYGIPLGPIVYILFILLSIFASSSISYARNKDNPGYRSLGLSGVTSAVVFAYILINPMEPIGFMFIPIPIKAWLFGLIYLAFEFYADRNKRTNIAHDAHIAGAVFGIVFILITNIEIVIAVFKDLTL